MTKLFPETVQIFYRLVLKFTVTCGHSVYAQKTVLLKGNTYNADQVSSSFIFLAKHAIYHSVEALVLRSKCCQHVKLNMTPSDLDRLTKS